MTTQGEKASGSGSNGRKVALIVVAIAFIASATTAMLAFTASHRAREADARALAADTSDLHAMLADWQTEVQNVRDATGGGIKPQLDGLASRTTALSAWKPRTPCGQEARDRPREAMEVRSGRLAGASTGQNAGNASADEAGLLDSALRECESGRGRDVNI